jgi:hypothetical protein
MLEEAEEAARHAPKLVLGLGHVATCKIGVSIVLGDAGTALGQHGGGGVGDVTGVEEADLGVACRGVQLVLADSATARAPAAIHAEPSHPWTVDQLGAAAGLSRAAFALAKAFRREYATAPGGYRSASRTGMTKSATLDPLT